MSADVVTDFRNSYALKADFAEISAKKDLSTVNTRKIFSK